MKFWNKIFFTSLLAVFCFSITTGYAQGEPSLEIRKMARETSAMWTKKLGLTEKQGILMETELIAYAMRKEVLLQSKMQEEAKVKRLLALQQEENGAMRNILTKPQYDRYVVLQKKLLDEQLKKRKKQ